MIALQNPDIKIMRNGEVDAYPQIILTNSHDGFNSFKFMLGIFRLVCSNGLVVCDNQMVNMTIRHINYTFDELRRFRLRISNYETPAPEALPEYDLSRL